MIDLTDWTHYNDFNNYSAWYRFLDKVISIPEGMDITFRDGRPIVAAIFEQETGVYMCACRSDDPKLLYGEMDKLWADDDVLEIIMLKIDIMLHGYGYRVVPCKKVLENK